MDLDRWWICNVTLNDVCRACDPLLVCVLGECCGVCRCVRGCARGCECQSVCDIEAAEGCRCTDCLSASTEDVAERLGGGTKSACVCCCKLMIQCACFFLLVVAFLGCAALVAYYLVQKNFEHASEYARTEFEWIVANVTAGVVEKFG